ncbi:MAG: 1-deoxy-D-xylulose-5-phosphate reductoisomerase [Candidatus Eisenbacteria bacterium]|uniref:1-deoxy-D-xylulose 5-phosphate reductoisomerase n=1 Tax=Eiseniibacteriota bacterium TaxID=2212470 RepID=A0A948RVX0_UNCEI|nr:1-deoxy-D-xylulose-5-phosphate reductoisomerase [Candidatus Eisenbacteria bacterium]MBU2690538.1 1-deoxy-D-xylulose-5-phosphate reductoisomerase [Candidatus Eisenbacteria bacterium]
MDVLALHRDRFKVFGLAAGTRTGRLADQIAVWKPERVVVKGPNEAAELRRIVQDGWQGEISQGELALAELAGDSRADIVVNGLVGALGLPPTLAALKTGRRVALANKESMVMAGPLLRETARRHGGQILPVDSEHSSLFQLLENINPDSVARLILTASGGPFRTLPLDQLKNVKVDQALDHPTWNMGPRITVDSASLMNKGLELIEACYLFQVPIDHIEVWIHPQSIVHALIELRDGSLLAQLSQPDMRIPIQYALTYPERLASPAGPCSLPAIGNLSFEDLDLKRYPCLALAQNAARRGGTAPAMLNAADEVFVNAFLREKIPFTDIPRLLKQIMSESDGGEADSVEKIMEADRWARNAAGLLVGSGT